MKMSPLIASIMISVILTVGFTILGLYFAGSFEAIDNLKAYSLYFILAIIPTSGMAYFLFKKSK